MERNQKKRAEPKEAPATMGESAVQIVNAETDIKEMAKEAVLKNEPKALYMRRVGAMLKKRLARVRSPTLAQKAWDNLPRFALEMFEKEEQLMRLYAALYQAMLDAKSKGVPGSKALYKNTVEYLGDVKKSLGFRIRLNVDPNMPRPKDIKGTGFDPELRSDEMKDDTSVPNSAYNTAVPLKQFYQDYMEKCMAVRWELIDSHAEDKYESNVSLRNIAEMTVRYEHQLDMVQGLKDKGENLVYIEPHANCSKRCEPYQVGGSKHPSGLYSLDGTDGKTPEGVPFRPLEFATSNPDDRYVSSKGKIYQNGCIYGYNCRHRLIPYRKGNKPLPIPARVIKEMREAEETQRAMEREIRQKEQEQIQTTTRDEWQKINSEIKAMRGKYVAFSRKHDLAYYPARLKVILYGS